MKGKTHQRKENRNIKKDFLCSKEFCDKLGGYYSDGNSFCLAHYLLYEKSKEGE